MNINTENVRDHLTKAFETRKMIGHWNRTYGAGERNDEKICRGGIVACPMRGRGTSIGQFKKITRGLGGWDIKKT